MISPYKIKWAGLSSLDLDVWTELSFDGDSGQTSTFLNRENVTTEHYDGRRTIHRSKHQEVLTPTITMIKQDYGDFSFDENRKMLSWLTSSEAPGYLEVFHDDSEVVSYRLFGNWTEVEQYKLGNGRVVGYVATFESNAPYAWSRKLIYPEVHKTTSEVINNDETNDYLQVYGTKPITITCNTDEYNKPIYPKVTINFSNSDIFIPIDKDPTKDNYVMIPNVIYKHGNNYYINLPSIGEKVQLPDPVISNMASTNLNSLTLGRYYYFSQEGVIAKVIMKDDKHALETITAVGVAVKIENETSGTDTIVAGAAMGETIILDGSNKVISAYTKINGALVQEPKIIGNNFSWKWLSLNYGDNNVVITGNCEVKIEWIEPRKVGSL